MGREHGDAHLCSEIYVLKYTECHTPEFMLSAYTLLTCSSQSELTLLEIRKVARAYYVCSMALRTTRALFRARTSVMYGGFARHGTHIYVNDFATSLGFLFVQRGRERKNNNNNKKKKRKTA